MPPVPEVEHGRRQPLEAADLAEAVFLAWCSVAHMSPVEPVSTPITLPDMSPEAREPARRGDGQRLVAVVVGLGEAHLLQPLGGDGDRRHRHVDAARLHRREEAVERDVLDLDLAAELLGHLVHEVDLEADEGARLVLELPGHVADVGADLQRFGPRDPICDSGDGKVAANVAKVRLSIIDPPFDYWLAQALTSGQTGLTRPTTACGSIRPKVFMPGVSSPETTEVP